MESPFDALPGVIKTTSGYTGGNVDKPSYIEVSDGKTGHYEAVEVTYDPSIVTYEKLLDVFWHNIDPFDKSGQFCDKGDQYRAVIFYRDDSQMQLAKTSLQTVSDKLGVKDLATAIKPAGIFYPAEEYHQNYYLKNPYTYKFYRYTCGRDNQLQQIWG
ncbi:MAG: peptide-methionine (S)-S-oxide reductase MsrA [Methylococcaceae bacterium]|nr:peptide-methionine (S)-S-oxide reductase MsrA [Methylococcaceae bacterium]